MITRRDLCVSVIAVTATLCSVAVFQSVPSVAANGSDAAVMHSSVFDWNSIPAKATNVGSVRKFFEAPTATLDVLECHVTTLNPGESSHAAHKHADEELVIVKEGIVECLSRGEMKRAGPGSVIFNASNEMHSIKNVGTSPATYHVIRWVSPGMKNKAPA
jgi:quercetin dioxygenase-like cupin family protein